jgi:2-polyprenyl-3-methyl-5-hydroxy-6-metoxy-1,4-benzoquinol methylase/spore coat polysaccharide biosynthesis predicted glycosyltransferase SpsG
MALVRGLRTLSRDAWILLPANNNANKLIDTAEFNRDWLITENGIPDMKWECIILDRFQTPPEELKRWTSLAPVIGIDEGGPVRNHFDFLIDILPNCNRIKANIADPSLLPLPGNIDLFTKRLTQRHEGTKDEEGNLSSSAPLKVLVSFGQEDPASLGPAVATALTAKNTGSIDITFLHGGLFTNHYSLTTTHYLPTTHYPLTTNLSEHLHEYDLIITHYGLTAFEALYAGVPVILLSPGGYHEKLAKAAGFYSAGVGKSRAAKLARLLLGKGNINHTFLDHLKIRCASLAAKYGLNHPPRQSLAELINSFTPDLSRNCPVCGAALQVPVLARFAERSYRRCNCCGIISMNRLNPPPISYQREYFFESYQKQYGLTYLEDFPHLTAMGKRRLAIIKSLLPDNITNAPLLDIGCAYGPFLAAAREEGFSPHGIDPAEDAVRYVTQTLNIPAVQGFFPNCSSLITNHYPLTTNPSSLITNHYPLPTTITLWYVIEHFRDCVPVLAEIRKLLKPGGVLAFATPSFSGVSGRFSLKRFLEHSPADHWTIWSPAVCKKALQNAGFRVKKTVNSGHHPERFPLLGKLVESKKGPLYRLLLAVSTIFSLGDTFEVYATAQERYK